VDRQEHLLCVVRVGVYLLRWRVSRFSLQASDSRANRQPNSDGKYGLWVDKVFQNGSSATSPAYANEVLCSTNGGAEERMKFDCMALEVWATSN
jgi:hypothetical protein